MIKPGDILYWKSYPEALAKECKFIKTGSVDCHKVVWTDLYGKSWSEPDKFYLADGTLLSEKDFDFPVFKGRVIRD